MNKLNHIWKNRLVTVLGFLVLIMPFLGFPHSWSDFFYFVLGLVIVILSFQLGRFLVYGGEDTTESEPETEQEKFAEKHQEKPKQERKHKTHTSTPTPVQSTKEEKPVTSDWDEEEKSV